MAPGRIGHSCVLATHRIKYVRVTTIIITIIVRFVFINANAFANGHPYTSSIVTSIAFARRQWLATTQNNSHQNAQNEFRNCSFRIDKFVEKMHSSMKENRKTMKKKTASAHFCRIVSIYAHAFQRSQSNFVTLVNHCCMQPRMSCVKTPKVLQNDCGGRPCVTCIVNEPTIDMGSNFSTRASIPSHARRQNVPILKYLPENGDRFEWKLYFSISDRP